ncbi:CHRD domain-containing protein [Jannaschia sp.]|nr:CHRD domain-containing protein [Jannaschia sp.]
MKFGVASTEILVTRNGGTSVTLTSAEGIDTVTDDVELYEFTDTTLTSTEIGDLADTNQARSFFSEIEGSQVTTPTGSDAFGSAHLLYLPSQSSVLYDITVEGLDFGTILPGFETRQTAETDDDVTTAHLHVGAAGANGGVAFAFLDDDNLTATLNDDGSWSMSGIWQLSEGLFDFLPEIATAEPGTELDLYWNIHTTGFPGGEIRGQVVSVGDATDNAITGSKGADTLTGLDGADTLEGGAGRDLLNGGTGDDSMVGGTGDDTYRVNDAGDDVVEAEDAGQDRVIATLTEYTLTDNVERLNLLGALDNNTDPRTGTGNALDNILGGNAGSTSTVALTFNGLGGNDTITSDAGDDTLNGGAGDDLLDGNGGENSLVGGEDDDRYIVRSAGDTVVEQAEEGRDGVTALLDGYTLTDNVEDLTLGGAAASGTGNALDNRIDGSGTTLANILSGQGGDDTLEGGSQGDQLFGGDDDDLLDGAAGDDTLDGGAGEDTAKFSVDSTEISVQRTTDGLIVTSAEGADSVMESVEFLAFDDQTLSYEDVEGMTLADRVFQVALDGDQVTVPTGSAATGTGYMLYRANTGEVRYSVTIEGLDFGTILPGFEERATEDTADDVTTAHIHAAARGADGGIAFAFLEDDDLTAQLRADGAWTFNGNWEASEGFADFETAFGTTAPGTDLDLYFNIHTTGFGGGEIRGQVVSSSDDTANAIDGTSGSDTLFGLGGDDTLTGLAGDDSLDGGSGADSMIGGLGDDSYGIDDADDVIVEVASEGVDGVSVSIDGYTLAANVENMTLVGGANTATGNALGNDIRSISSTDAKTLSGEGGDDTLFGANGNDTLLGGADDDILVGGNGDDSMIGGTGDDAYSVTDAGDAVVEASGEGVDTVSTGIDGYVLGANVEALNLSGDASGTGNALDNAISSSSATGVTLSGLDGADTLSAGAGDDTLLGGTGDDEIGGGAGTDIAVIAAASTDAALAVADGGLMITSTDGVDLIREDVEFVEFSDTTISVDDLLASLSETRFFQIALDQGQVTTPTGSTATGTGFALFEEGGSSAAYSMTVTGLDFGTLLPGFDDRATADTADDVTTAHIHVGARGSDGGVVFAFLDDDDLTATLNDDGSWTMTGIWAENEGFDAFQTAFATTAPGEDLDLYVNIHTTGFEGGEIRGQIVSAADGSDNAVTGTSGNDTVLGLDGNDTLTGADGGDLLDGGAGADSMIGGAGDDLYRVDDAGDVVVEAEGGGDDGVTVSIDGYTLADNVETLRLLGMAETGTGNGLANAIFASDSASTLLGAGGRDTLTGGAAEDTLDGGTGADRMIGGDGDDTYRVDNRLDRIVETVDGGSDTVLATSQVNLRDAEIEAVILEGNSNARVNGNGFATAITGNAGANILIGGGGGDTVEGGDGDDFFAFLLTDADGTTVITDFSDGDQLALDDRLFGLGDGGVDPRNVTANQVVAALNSGAARYDRSTGELTVDVDGRRGPEDPEVIAIFEGRPVLSPDDILLF